MKADNDLIKEFQNGSRLAFDNLVRKHLDETYEFFLKICGDSMEAEDLAQDVFLKLYSSLKKFRFESEFKTYLYRVNMNTANNYLQRSKWRRLLHLDSIPEQIDKEQSAELGWKKAELWAAIGKLSKKQRMVVTLRIGQNMSHKDIAKVIGISESSSKTNYHHGVNKLKHQMGV